MSNLLQSVKNDITDFLSKQKMFFFNERDLQVNLALYLSNLKDKDYKVHLEYHIPTSELNNYPWTENNISIDLVVEKNGEYVPVELKYKTCSLPEGSKINRFGEPMCAKSIVKNQSAQDLGRYGFWKDVKRLELLKKKYEKKIAGGIVLFVTNDKSYTIQPQKESVGYYNFRMLDAQPISGTLKWKVQGKDCETKDQPYVDIALEKIYTPQWNHYSSEMGEEMYFVLMTI